MVIIYPEFFKEEPGAALDLPPYESAQYVDITGPPGSISGLYYGLMFQLGRLGYDRVRIDEWIDVSPMFKQYFDLTVQQKQAIEAQIKAGLAQIASAIHDYELVFHDLRKYKEFLDFFTEIEQGKDLIKKGKKEEGVKLRSKGEQTLKAIFIDQVDIHTDLPNTPIALRSIVGRWPTIIADFMRLSDEDVEAGKIAKKINVSEAEGVVLATKNKLFLEWRDKLFKETVTERYQRILRLVEARRTSITEYTNMLKPVITRYKLIADALETPGGRAAATKYFFRPDAQAFSLDFMRVWAWKPFVASEKYKVTRESLTQIPMKKAGFRKEEIGEIIKHFKKEEEKRNLTDDEKLVLKGMVNSLPTEPSIDYIVRRYVPQIEKEYGGVKLDTIDVFNARARLTDSFIRHATEMVYTETRREPIPGAGWVFSPYFIFLDIPILRAVIRMPNGEELENWMSENYKGMTRTQNIIILNILESIAREKKLENYIGKLVGEIGGKDLKTIEDIAREQYPEIFGKMEKKKGGKINVGFNQGINKSKRLVGDVLAALGLKINFLRAPYGPYEFSLKDRLSELYQAEYGGAGPTASMILNYLKQAAGVPGVRW